MGWGGTEGEVVPSAAAVKGTRLQADTTGGRLGGVRYEGDVGCMLNDYVIKRGQKTVGPSP